MTSISLMQAQCPDCNHDLRELVHHLTIGDSEDTDEITCPECNAELEVELIAMFEIRKKQNV